MSFVNQKTHVIILFDNYEKLGLPIKDVKDMWPLEKQWGYKGIPIIRERAKEIGRKGVLEEFRKDPLSYWNMISAKVPAYQDILK